MRTLASASSLHAPHQDNGAPRLATEENPPRSKRGKKTEEELKMGKFSKKTPEKKIQFQTGAFNPVSFRR
jgi:hypothetical protein